MPIKALFLTVCLMIFYATNSLAEEETNPCDLLKASQKIKYMTSYFNNLSAQPNLWFGYNVANFSFAVIDGNTTLNCVLVITPLSAMEYYESKTKFPDPGDSYAELDKIVLQNHLKSQLSKSVSDVVTLVGFSHQISGLDKKRSQNLFGTLLHEGYHFNTQKSDNWQSMRSEPLMEKYQSYSSGESFLQHECYTANREVEKIFWKEFKTAFIIIDKSQQGHLSEKLINKFISLRKQRYLELEKIDKVRRALCEESEAGFEYSEGIPQYIEDEAKNNFTDFKYSKNENYKHQKKLSHKADAFGRMMHPYYFLGSAQIYATRYLLSKSQEQSKWHVLQKYMNLHRQKVPLYLLLDDFMLGDFSLNRINPRAHEYASITMLFDFNKYRYLKVENYQAESVKLIFNSDMTYHFFMQLDEYKYLQKNGAIEVIYNKNKNSIKSLNLQGLGRLSNSRGSLDCLFLSLQKDFIKRNDFEFTRSGPYTFFCTEI